MPQHRLPWDVHAPPAYVQVPIRLECLQADTIFNIVGIVYYVSTLGYVHCAWKVLSACLGVARVDVQVCRRRAACPLASVPARH